MPPEDLGIVGIQTNDTTKDPNEGVKQKTLSGGSQPSVSGIGTIQGDPLPPPPDDSGSSTPPVVKPVVKVDKTVSKPVDAIGEVSTDGLKSIVKPIGVVDKRVADPVKPLKPVTIDPVVGTPPELGVDFAEVRKQQEDQRKRMTEQFEAKEAVDLKNVQNTFSHLFSRGQDSGRMNAANLAAVRDAGRRFDDAKLNLDNQFFNSQIRLTELEATEDARIRESQRNKWESGMKEQIDNLVSLGLYEEASEVAKQASDVSGNKFFSSMTNPNVISALQDREDVESSAAWAGSLNSVNSLAINHADSPQFMKDQAIASMFDEMKSNPARAHMLVDSFFDNLNEESYAELDVDTDDQKIIDDFDKGIRDISDPEVQKVFGDVYMEDIKQSNQRAKVNDSIEAAGISSFIQESPVGNEIVTEWLTDPTSDMIKIDVEQDPVFGAAGISEISFFGRPITDANQLAAMPGLDIAFEDFNEQPIVGEYTIEDAKGDTVIASGVEYNQGELMDAYLAYVKQAGKEFTRATDAERAVMQDPLNKDQFLGRLESLTQETGEKVDMGTLINDIKGVREVAPDVTISAAQYTDPATGNIETLPQDLVDAMDEERQEQLVSILEGTEDIHALSDNEMKRLLQEGTTGEDLFNPAVVDLLRSKGTLVEMDTPTQLQRESMVQDKNHEFSTENLDEMLSNLKVEGGSAEGWIEMDGEIWEVSGQPSRHHTSKGGDWLPVVEWNLTPMFDREKDSVVYKTQIPHEAEKLARGGLFGLGKSGSLEKATDFLDEKSVANLNPADAVRAAVRAN